MNSLLKFRKPLSSYLTSLSLHRFSSTLNYVFEETKEATSFIHPTAVVHPKAVIGQGVSVGPFCTIGSSAKLGNGCHLHPSSHIFGNTELGNHCILMTGAVVGDDLPGRTVIGSNSIIGHHAVVGIKCQDMKYKVIGDNNLIMGSCHIAHDCKIGNNNIFANSTLLAGHIIVEDYVHTAGAIVVHQFCHIGSFSFIGGGSVVSQDVPKYMMVSGGRAELRGLNLEGLRRRGFHVTEIRSLRTAYRKIFMPSNSNSMAFDERLSEVISHDNIHIFKLCILACSRYSMNTSPRSSGLFRSGLIFCSRIYIYIYIYIYIDTHTHIE
ncbi:probable acyl-[acyl-carrier-protein]--UDP-N-acetylglucosamine O-acyltransferase, mitochondrial isoform X4 [Durio zibethinus]|uniref:Probable acyl-[acyl-carrier-protein]--UDP-N-acetylglucosamine O-acyltransferase, mitochondrial isoform X4 n=1 Tax=Durio zibethinus TaxID=66656 RepID=A0A6P5ZPU4_DURZI|nr:probable acyl-[acyl-carrier-protein]--UDP-N-acetylglucosamine O-acyltransferase, mitochondrial isoform X4 [Durio zibethinus]